MPGTSKAKNPKGFSIEFFEETHKYLTMVGNKEVQYTSGTAFSHPFFPEFDPTGEITKRCALREGLTVEQVKAKWKAKGDESCRLGTRTHETCEDVFHNQTFRNQPEDEEERRRFHNAISMSKKIKERVDIVGIEMIVFDVDLALAGTIDFFGRSKKDGTYVIIDHKTNKDLGIDNKYKKFAFDPISHIPDTGFGHYLCQLNLYQYLLKYGQYVPKDAKFKMYLNHITPETAELIEVPNDQEAIKDMMIEYLLKYKKEPLTRSTDLKSPLPTNLDTLFSI